MQIDSNRTLRNLYSLRAVVQLLWAGAVLALTVKTPLVGSLLLVLYPLWDVACTLYDLNTNEEMAAGARNVQRANVAMGLATAVALAIFLKNEPFAVASFGVWALMAGLMQLAVGIIRKRESGGQWAMILSGAQSTLAGTAFILGGLSGKFHAKDLGGYAVFGAIYFTVSALLLTRRMRKTSVA